MEEGGGQMKILQSEDWSSPAAIFFHRTQIPTQRPHTSYHTRTLHINSRGKTLGEKEADMGNVPIYYQRYTYKSCKISVTLLR